MLNRNRIRRRPQQQSWNVKTLHLLILSSIIPLLQSEVILQPLEKNIISGVTVTPPNRRPPRQVIYQDYVNDNQNVPTNENIPIILRPLTSNKHHPIIPTKDLPIYYYNATNREQNKLPNEVYDKEGNVISIDDLIQTNNDILLETDGPHPHPPKKEGVLPPPTLIPLVDLKDKSNGQETNFKPKRNNQTPSPTPPLTPPPTNKSTTTKTNVTKTTKQKTQVNPSDWEHIAPEAQDQMIIVSTVATMAILVGALSARRLRSRQFLSSCIENESLEDELAYDTAFTEDRFGKGYDTFSSVPWKGDLEKFDV